MTATGAILFLIPARGGSRRVPGKNLRTVGGIPLAGWAARIGAAAARATPGGPHRVVCSTDDDAIAAAASTWGAETLARPAALATDDATSIDVAIHALDTLAAGGAEFETLVLLQPTSPLTDPADVIAAIEQHRERGGVGVTSVVAGHPSTWQYRLGAGGALTARDATSSRIESDPAEADATESDAADVRVAGAFYVAGVAALRETRRFVVPGVTLGLRIPAERAIDIDEELEFVLAEALLSARPVRPVLLGGRTIGTGPAFVIAEAGVNHDGDPALAHRLIDAAAAAGADAVKFQTFDPAALAVPGAPTAAYQREAGVDAADQRALLARLALPRDSWPALQAHAREAGLVFLSTPFDDGSAALLDALDVPAFKVGSGELTNTPFLARLARFGRPILVSTGMADMTEVAAAVDTIRSNGDVPLALFHCVSSYPAAVEDANLRAIETMRRAFGVPVGWSDHTDGIDLPAAAVAAGASLIEKHLTLDRGMAGPDHRASLEPAAFGGMVEGIRRIEAALGTGHKAPVEGERDVAAVARRSLYWRASRPAGHVIEAVDVDVLRPAGGLPPSRLASIVGATTARAVEAGAAIDANDLAGGR